MSYDPYGALYIHIPFCKQRCLYCDFTTNAVELDNPAVRTYVDNLVLEIRHAGKEGKLKHCKTIYFGGGTPSYLGQKYLTEILYMLGLSLNITADMEVSMEANPDSLNEALVKDLWALGVNRLSIGVQSFDDAVLKTLGRIHDAEAAKNAIRAASLRFENISADLMCGIPDQSKESFLSDVQQALDLGVKHISIYPLTIEEGTPFYWMVRSGQLADIEEDAQADMMEAAGKILSQRGLHRYEVASYAYPGFECRHNIAYWTGVPYLGLGHSAVTMTQNSEKRMRVQDDCVVDDLNARQMLAEDLMLGMRLSRGIDKARIEEASLVFPELFCVLESLCERGLLICDADGWHPSELGWLCGNELYGPLLNLAP